MWSPITMNPLARPWPFSNLPPLGALLWGAFELVALARSRWIIKHGRHRGDARGQA
jgi:hypothetical protein